MKTTYELRVKSDSDTDIQPTVASLESPLVESIEGTDTSRVRVELVDGADAKAYEALMDSDADVYHYLRIDSALCTACRETCDPEESKHDDGYVYCPACVAADPELQ